MKAVEGGALNKLPHSVVLANSHENTNDLSDDDYRHTLKPSTFARLAIHGRCGFHPTWAKIPNTLQLSGLLHELTAGRLVEALLSQRQRSP